MDKIIWCYDIAQTPISDMAEKDPIIELHHGFDPDLYMNKTKEDHYVLVIDDLVSDDSIYPHLSDLFIKYARHYRITTILLTQNIFFRAGPLSKRYARNIISNCTELVLFRNLKDGVIAQNVGRQSFPHNYKYFMQVFQDATKASAHSYLYMSFHPESDSRFLLRANIFYKLETPVIYLEK